MNSLHNFLEQQETEFTAELGQRGGYIQFSNSGRRGTTKSFHISLEALYQTLADIKDHIHEFRSLQSYDEGDWRQKGERYFTNEVAKSIINVQTKPLFSTLSKLIKWANIAEYESVNPDSSIVLNEQTLSNALKELNTIIEQYTPTLQDQAEGKSLQTIYFGAPGSGKSHKVAQKLGRIDEGCIFRTTLHPDSDYASFVGCYKPDMKSEPTWEEHYDFDELLEIILKEVVTGEPYAVEKFCLRHYRAIDRLNLSREKRDRLRRRILNASKGTGSQGDTVQTATVDVGIHLGKYLEEQGILSRTGRSTEITYSFTPQVFTNAYVRAWQEADKDIYLVIEEINRGNCAQIFGDLFQLLDRDERGFSCYKIKADKDLAHYLEEILGKDHEGIKGGDLRLPSNLHIMATMNTSDQSLFPMDSAFKRRWDWVYVPISYNEDKSSKFEISIGDKKYLWVKFLEKVNTKILEATQSEDKQMGNFFIKRSIGEEEFKSKVMFYLWHEVCKDEYRTKNNFFRYTSEDGEKEFSFNDLHTENGSTILQGFMAYLGISPINGDSEPTEGPDEQPS